MAYALKKTAAIALAAGVALGGSAGIAGVTPAHAVTQVNENGAATKYSLTVQKRDLAGQQPGTSDGSEQARVPGELPATPAGFTFRIERVTPAAGATPDNPLVSQAQPTDPRVEFEGTTDESGTIRFNNLPAGVYRVTETAVPANSGFVAGPPFLVSVPVTNQTGTETIDEVFVYPKNTRAGIEKTVQDKDTHGGQNYTYTIASDIPDASEPNKTLASYRVVDNLDGRLGLQSVEVRIGTSWENATPVPADNYTLTPTTIPAEPNQTGHNIEVKFTDQGLAQLAGAEAGARVFTRITATAPANVDVIPNKATLYFNNGSGAGEVHRDSDEVKTYWGSLTINKVGPNGTSPLAGAEFRLVKCTAGTDGYVQVPNTEDLTVNGQNRWSTGQEGEVVITGIHATDFADNTADDTLLCAQETKAPAGFQLDERLIPFVLRSGQGNQADPAPIPNVTGEAGQLSYKFTLTNKPSDRFLPNTGGMGIALLILVGLGIVGAGVYAARRNAA